MHPTHLLHQVPDALPRLRLRAVPAPIAQDEWRPGLFVGGPLDGEVGPLDGDRLTVVRDGVVYRYSVLVRSADEGEGLRAWIFAGQGALD